MRPDRIIVGEVRGGEALDMLQAMNTGHEGSLSTAHANSPRDLLARLETMALMSDVDLPVSHVREQIAGALDVIIHMTRLSDGRRAVSRVSAVEGLRNGRVLIQDIFTWRRGPVPGLEATGTMPSLLRLLRERDERVDPRIFRLITGPAPAAVTSNGARHAEQREPVPLSPWPGPLRRLGAILE
jgi:pilus assembly protein CpaF